MGLLKDLIESVNQKDAEVRQIVAGDFWTFVASSDWGVASTLECAGGHLEATDSFSGKRARDLLELAFSDNTWEASLGVAAMNSLIVGEVDPRHFKPYRIPTARDKKIAVAGDFAFTDHLRTIAQEVCVIERNLETRDYAGAEQAFRDADVALIAGAAVVDHALESLLGLAGPCYTIVYGPSTPLSPILFRYGADQLVGVRVKDETAARKCIREKMRYLSECPGIAPVVMEAGQQSR